MKTNIYKVGNYFVAQEMGQDGKPTGKYAVAITRFRLKEAVTWDTDGFQDRSGYAGLFVNADQFAKRKA